MNKYIRVKVSGKNSNYFINKLISKNILYSNLCIFSKYIEFDLDSDQIRRFLRRLLHRALDNENVQ